MNLKVYAKIAAFVTIIALLYIHMQTKILELSYNGKDKEKVIHELNDSNGVLNHQILTLTSADNLGNRLLGRDGSFQFMDNERVMTVTTGWLQHTTKPQAKVESPVWSLFSFLGIQEAKAWE